MVVIVVGMVVIVVGMVVIVLARFEGAPIQSRDKVNDFHVRVSFFELCMQ